MFASLYTESTERSLSKWFLYCSNQAPSIGFPGPWHAILYIEEQLPTLNMLKRSVCLRCDTDWFNHSETASKEPFICAVEAIVATSFVCVLDRLDQVRLLSGLAAVRCHNWNLHFVLA